MRILQFGRYNFDELKGGVQFYAHSLTEELRKTIEVDLLVSSLESQTKIEKQSRGWRISVGSWGLLQSVPLSPGMIFWALKLCRTRHYDLIHLNFPDPLSLLVAFFLPKKIPLVVTWHADVIRQRKFVPIYMIFLKKIMKRVVKVIVATPYHMKSCPQLMVQENAEAKTVVIPFGIDHEIWKLTPENEKKAQILRQKYSDQLLLFSFGRHVTYKGYIYLLEALAKTENVHLILGGEGPLTGEFKAFLQAKDLESKVTFCGLIPQAEIPVFLAACDLFCFPSIDKTEAFGYTQVEAMISGRPILSTFLNNGVNYVSMDGKTGTVVEPKNPDQLRQAILDFQKHPEKLRQYGQNARERAFTEFTAQKMAERTVALYREVILTSGTQTEDLK